MIKYSQQDISAEDIQAVVDALKGDVLTQGPLLLKFESKVAERVAARYAISTNSATSALHLSCIALGLKKGDIVWTSPISFVASANCALYCRASVDFVDIDPDTALMSVELLEIKLKHAEKIGKLPKILIPVHLAGSICNMKRISQLSKKYGFAVIEDASHAIGATYFDQPVGNCKYSDITIFSFHPVKVMTTLEGGIAVTNNKLLADKISKLRGHGITRKIDEFELERPGPWYYEQQDLGFNYRFNEIQAALGISQLSRLDDFLVKRHLLMKNYEIAFNDSPNIKFLLQPEGTYSAYHLAIVSILKASKDQHRNLFNYMRNNDIFVQLHYWPIHLHPFYRKMGFQEGDYPNSERYGVTSFSMPLYTSLELESQKKVIEILKKGIVEMNLI